MRTRAKDYHYYHMSILDDEQEREKVRAFVRATGNLTSAWGVTKYTSKIGFFHYLKKHPSYHQELKELKAFSTIKNRPDFIKKTIAGLERHLSGPKSYHRELNPDNDETISLYEHEKPPSRWALEFMLSKGSLTEESIDLLLASQVRCLSNDSSLSPEVKQQILLFFDRYKNIMMKEIILQHAKIPSNGKRNRNK